MTYDAFLESIGVDSFPPVGREVWEQACAEYAAQACVYCTDAYLDTLSRDLDCFPRSRDFIYRTAAAIRGQEPLERFIVLLAHALRRDARGMRAGAWTLPQSPPGADPAPYEMTGFFAELALMPEAARTLRRRGVPEQVVRDTMACPDWCILIFSGLRDRPGYSADRVRWTLHYLIPDILRIGRLEFEMAGFASPMRVFANASRELFILADGCRLHASGQLLGSPGCDAEEGAFDAGFCETELYYEGHPVRSCAVSPRRIRLSKARWTPFVSPGDPVLRVHIPARLPFDRESVLDSYTRARAVFGLYYPDYPFRAFTCTSWLMDPALRGLLGEDSNIVRFQSDYLRYPAAATGRAVYGFLFDRPDARTPEELPAHSSLQRRVRERMLSGGYILEQGGILMPQALA